MADAEAIIKVCDIYDWDGKGEIDLFFLGDVIYALGMNTTKKVCVSLGLTDDYRGIGACHAQAHHTQA